MTTGEPKPEVIIRVGGPQKFDPPTRESLLALKAELAQAGFDVSIPMRKTADSAWASLAQIGIYLGEHISDGTVDYVIGSVTTAVGIWLKGKFKKEKKEGKPPEATVINIYGLDTEILLRLLAKNEDDIRDITPELGDD